MLCCMLWADISIQLSTFSPSLMNGTLVGMICLGWSEHKNCTWVRTKITESLQYSNSIMRYVLLSAIIGHNIFWRTNLQCTCEPNQSLFILPSYLMFCPCLRVPFRTQVQVQTPLLTQVLFVFCYCDIMNVPFGKSVKWYSILSCLTVLVTLWFPVFMTCHHISVTSCGWWTGVRTVQSGVMKMRAFQSSGYLLYCEFFK